MNKLIYVLVLTGLNSFSQNLEKELFNDFNSSPYCQGFYNNAKEDVKAKGFIIPSICHYTSINNTFSEILYRKYSFVGKNQTTECITTSKHCCYEKGLLDTISDYFGGDFLEETYKYSDSLDKLGLGYNRVLLKNDTFNLVEKLVEKTYIDSTLAKLNDGYKRLLLIEIDSVGKIVFYEYQEARDYFILEFEKVENEISKELYAIIEKNNSFKPATLEGKVINSKRIIYLHPLYINDEDNSF